MKSFEDSILRVLKGDSVVGAAFLVSDRLVATCAHVVKSAGVEVGEKISLRLSNGKNVDAVVEPEFWRDVNAEDIAILRLNESIQNIQPAILGSSSGAKGHSFSTFGFPKQGQELFGGGEIIGQAAIDGIKVLQLRSAEVTPGFSGAPVFDETTKRVVGMVVAITPPDEYQRLGTTAFAIPSETIRTICPELQISDICPYRSLDVFNEEDAQFFFGREALTEKLVNILRGGCRYLALFGPSGSGKSSVVRAGLLPVLKKDQLPGSQRWAQITMRPADNPFEQMKTAGLDPIDVNGYLKSHADANVERVVLFIDQFEELFTLCPDNMRDRFARDLATALENSKLILILSMRNDFYGAFYAKVALLAESNHLKIEHVPENLKRNELVAMIERPAETVGLALEEGLAELILKDVTTDGEASSSTLPLLEFALTQLWEKRHDGLLTHKAYQAIGGVMGSLARWADDAYSELPKSDQALTKNLLTLLVHLGDEAQGLPDTRRRRTLTELGASDSARRVIKHFADQRLIITSGETIELVHDALVREWNRLKGWVKSDRDNLRLREGVGEAARQWKVGGKDESLLNHRGARLELALAMSKNPRYPLSDIEQKYLEACLEVEEREKAKNERLKARQSQIEALMGVGRAINSSLGLKRVLEEVMDTLIELMRAERGFLMLRDSNGELSVRLARGIAHINLEEETFKVSRTIVKRVADSGEPILTTNAQDDPRFENHMGVAAYQLRSILCAPLKIKNELIGVIYVDNRAHSGIFREEDLGLITAFADQAAVAIDNARLFENSEESNRELERAYQATLEGWVRALDLRDKETEGHTLRVTEMTMLIARAMGFGENDLVHIRRGALLHDIGKMGVPDAILFKPGYLTEPEWSIMRLHPVYAFEMLSPIGYLRQALDIPYCHHERWDGTGYPRGLKGEEIPLFARLFAIVETYDILMSNRPFRPGISKDKTLDYISEQRGKHFDPALVEIFLNWIKNIT